MSHPTYGAEEGGKGRGLQLTDSSFGPDPIYNETYLPDLVVILDTRHSRGAIRECTGRNVPTIGIIDSDTDPRLVTYPIPANADSIRTIELIAGSLSLAGQEGRNNRLRKEEKRKQQEKRDRQWRREAYERYEQEKEQASSAEQQ